MGLAKNSGRRLLAALAVALVTIGGAAPLTAQAAPPRPAGGNGPVWVGTWTTGVTGPATDPVPATVFDRQTLRQVVHTSIGGRTVRVRLSNEFGTVPLRIGVAHVARRAERSSILPGTDRLLTFGGRRSITIPAHAPALSDPVDLNVPADSDLAVSLYLPRRTPGNTVHGSAFQSSYVVAGDATDSTTLQNPTVTTSWYFLAGVSVVEPSRRAGSVVTFGDSITDGAITTVDGNHRWPDFLARRLQGRRDLNRIGVLNQGISGNRLLHDGITLPDSPAPGIGPLFGPSGLSRFDRDVLAQPGVRFVTVLLGINDIGQPGSFAPSSEAVTVAQLKQGYRQLIERAHQHGLTIVGATLTPFQDTTIPGYYTPQGEAKRQAVNRWIRTSGEWDGVIDFDRAVRDPARPLRMLARYDSGDHLHPNDLGMRAMADAIDLDLFTGGPGGTPSHPVVTTDRGAVRGTRAGAVDSFLGIRYAAAPVGARRWAPPQLAPRWEGVRDATHYGSRCAAAASTNGPRSESEDCLFVNVQRPSGLRAGSRRPVYVFIHGGGLLNGSSNQAEAGDIVRRTGVVAVTFNYRLGVLGFLAHPALRARDGESGNYGLMDQQAALRWIRRNAARFGGDPEQVTVGGESAGGWSVCAHLVSPGARGLFQRAMIQSGSCPSRTAPAAEEIGRSFADAVHCSDPDTALACLLRTPVGALIDAPSTDLTLPVRGTSILPGDPRKAIASGAFRRVPVVVGATRDEGRTFSQGNIGWSRSQYTSWVRQTFPSIADEVLLRYPWPANATRFTAAYLTGAIFTDSGLLADIGGCANRRLTMDLARYTRTWAYEFAHRTGPGLTPEPKGYVWGAGHATELAYLFPSFDNGTPIAPTFNAGERRLAREMKSYWGTFARIGRPDVAGQPTWTRYDASGRVLSLRAGGRSTLVSDATVVAEHQCGFWDHLSPAARAAGARAAQREAGLVQRAS